MAQPAVFSSARTSDVLIAGVPWPRHKAFALLTGLLTLLLIGAVTASAAPAVLGGTAVALAVGLAIKVLTNPRD